MIGNDFGSAFWLPRNLFRGINHNNYQMKLRFKIKCVYIGRFQKKLHHCVQNLIPFPNKLLLDPFGNNWRNIFFVLANKSCLTVCLLTLHWTQLLGERAICFSQLNKFCSRAPFWIKINWYLTWKYPGLCLLTSHFIVSIWNTLH